MYTGRARRAEFRPAWERQPSVNHCQAWGGPLTAFGTGKGRTKARSVSDAASPAHAVILHIGVAARRGFSSDQFPARDHPLKRRPLNIFAFLPASPLQYRQL